MPKKQSATPKKGASQSQPSPPASHPAKIDAPAHGGISQEAFSEMTASPETSSDEPASLERSLQEIAPQETTSYDQVPYPSYPYSASHPDRLHSIAKLFGLAPKPPAQARVLELGSAAGGNILPIAAQFPECQVVGIDLSARQIAEGQQSIEACQLTNARLIQANIAELPEDLGQFDYILCHGVFSWVPESVQEEIFRICREHLNPDGVCYISYNTLPGWYMRNAIRGMMLKHVGTISDPAQKLTQARALLKFLVESTENENSPYAQFLKSETELLSKQSDQYLFHDHLEENNHPCFFSDFVRRAGEYQLQFLGESSLASMWMGNLPEKASKTLTSLTQDSVLSGQYSDFIRNRMFRQTLLVHREQRVDRNLNPARIADAYFRGRFALEGDTTLHLNPGVTALFKSASGHTVQTSEPLFKALLVCVSEAYPGSLSMAQIMDQCQQRLQAQLLGQGEVVTASKDRLGILLIQLILSGALDFAFQPDRFVSSVSAAPATTVWTRYQATQGEHVTTLRHDVTKIGKLEQNLLPLIDGTRTPEQITEATAALIQRGVLQMNSQQPLTAEQADQALRVIVAKLLQRFAVQGLLVS
jgi:methyltransferase-like protein/cyclopropane fatty-acyl-phospholipid synthase-like methyltransferase